jgi:hypothetical protein
MNNVLLTAMLASYKTPFPFAFARDAKDVLPVSFPNT